MEKKMRIMKEEYLCKKRDTEGRVYVKREIMKSTHKEKGIKKSTYKERGMRKSIYVPSK